VHKARMSYYRTVMGFDVEPRAIILTDVRFARRRNMTIREGAVINNGCRIDNRFSVTVGRSSSLSYGTFVITKGHDIEDPQFRTKGAPVVIGDYVWCTVRSTVLPGVTVGDRAVVLPGSVVTSDVSEAHVVGGIPATTVRMRDAQPHNVPPYTGHNPVFG
jgi:acetyltransferase-like isoleucine patch superfamily enzyme